jgi:glycosyltransferase involved in cell wall biosynthesis
MSPPVEPSRIRVLFILNSLCVGGAERQVVSLINRLDRHRHEVSLVCVKEDGPLRDQLEAGSCAGGVHVLGVRKGLEWQALRDLARLIDGQQIDVIVCTNMYALLYGWLARWMARRRPALVEVFHTTYVASRKERLQMRLYRPILRMTDLLVCVCHAQARLWRERGVRAREDTVIHNGIDTAQFEDVWSAAQKLEFRRSQDLEAGDYVVGLCAVMRPEKAHADLVSAVAQLKASGLDVKCLLIGGGPERRRIEAQTRALGATAQVRITGLLDDVRPAVAACDVMVLTSHEETFSLAALEAMMLGKPMVMTDVGGAAEQVIPGHNGLLYPAGDVAALADCLRTLADPALRSAVGPRATALVRERFDIGHMVRGYERAFARLAARRASAAYSTVVLTD